MIHADYKTASQWELLCPLLIEINKFYQSINVTNEELPCLYGNELLRGSSKGMEFDGLKKVIIDFVSHTTRGWETISERGFVL